VFSENPITTIGYLTISIDVKKIRNLIKKGNEARPDWYQ